MALLTRMIKMEQCHCSDPLVFFKEHHNTIIHFKKEYSFIRYIGMNQGDSQYFSMIKEIDSHMAAQHMNYIRLTSLDSYMVNEKSEDYIQIFHAVNQWDSLSVEKLHHIPFPFVFQQQEMNLTVRRAFYTTLHIYKRNCLFQSDTIVKNFAVKLLFWSDIYLPELFQDHEKVICFPKLMWTGKIKEQEYLFLYFLSLIGCDILYMNPLEDIKELTPLLKELSILYDYPTKKDLIIPTHMPVKAAAPPPVSIQVSEPVRSVSKDRKPIAIKIPDNRPLIELEYEQLAMLSTSIVLVYVYNRHKKCISSGSGVMINDKGYILTNFHVVNDGAYYGIRMENEEQEYTTDALIKYHAENDLALLRVDKKTIPIPLAPSDSLVRGQKIVAIGSPLGLFNTISNGIISGFRDVKRVSTIQFTAPISNGSSGGSLLDLYGRLAGITYAGFDSGQNLNLAIHVCEIKNFLQGFLN